MDLGGGKILAAVFHYINWLDWLKSSVFKHLVAGDVPVSLDTYDATLEGREQTVPSRQRGAAGTGQEGAVVLDPLHLCPSLLGAEPSHTQASSLHEAPSVWHLASGALLFWTRPFAAHSPAKAGKAEDSGN